MSAVVVLVVCLWGPRLLDAVLGLRPRPGESPRHPQAEVRSQNMLESCLHPCHKPRCLATGVIHYSGQQDTVVQNAKATCRLVCGAGYVDLWGPFWFLAHSSLHKFYEFMRRNILPGTQK